MPCFSPLHGYRARALNPSGKRSIVFSVSDGYRDLPVTVRCGQCLGCRLERSRQWALRCHHEAAVWPRNTFITLTYDADHLPASGSLHKPDFQKFMKRLRKATGQKKLRYYMCGEYGEKSSRPHYHAILFNWSFDDQQVVGTRGGFSYYESGYLSKLWPQGIHRIGEANFKTAAYVARYITKKITGPRALLHYNTIDSRGEVLAERIPEYNDMSRRPGVGKEWYDRFKADAYPADFLVLDGKKIPPPRYYDSLYEVEFPEKMAEIKSARKRRGAKHAVNNTPERLAVREEILQLKFDRLIRGYENGT